MVGFLSWLDITIDLFDLESVGILLDTEDHLHNDGGAIGIVSEFNQLLRPHKDNISPKVDEYTRAALVQSSLKEIALSTRLQKKEQQLAAAKQIIGTFYRDCYPNELFNRLSYCGNNKSLVENDVRVALKEMMQRRHHTLQQQHSWLGILPQNVEDGVSSTDIQVRDAVHHYIKMNDQQGSIGVSASDIYSYIHPILVRNNLSTGDMSSTFSKALRSLLRATKIGTFGTETPPRFFVSVNAPE
mmetsp:Transcript_13522/g.21083  ORF Transcript_13522/g.21083 Transcript_13522/m.21083 type:complete len:243 (+) Transcript_13522:754-1482(+)